MGFSCYLSGYRFSFGDDWPLREFEINRLEINRESFLDLLDTTDLCIRLFSEMVINNRQKQFIFSKPTDCEKNEALLDMLTKFSIRQYNQTIACLNESNQRHVADLLSEGGGELAYHHQASDSLAYWLTWRLDENIHVI